MIKIRIKNADHEIDIRFPISESVRSTLSKEGTPLSPPL